MSNIGDLITKSINILSIKNINENELNDMNYIYINSNDDSDIDKIIHLNFLKIIKKIYDNNNIHNDEYFNMINNFFLEKIAFKSFISFNYDGNNYVAIIYKKHEEYKKQIDNLKIIHDIIDNDIIKNSISYIEKDMHEDLYKQIKYSNTLIYDAFDSKPLKFIDKNIEYNHILLDLLSLFEFIDRLQKKDYIHRNIYSHNIVYKNNRFQIIDFTTMIKYDKIFNKENFNEYDSHIKPIQIEKSIYDHLFYIIKNNTEFIQTLKEKIYNNLNDIKKTICETFQKFSYVNYLNKLKDDDQFYDNIIFYDKIQKLISSNDDNKKNKKYFYIGRFDYIINDICQNNDISINQNDSIDNIIDKFYLDYIRKYAKTYDIYSVHEIIYHILYSKISSNYDEKQKIFLASLAMDCFHINENGNNINKIIEKIKNSLTIN